MRDPAGGATGPDAPARRSGVGLALPGGRIEVVLVVGEGLPGGQGEGEDEVVVLGLASVAAEVDELVGQAGDAGRGLGEAELFAA